MIDLLSDYDRAAKAFGKCDADLARELDRLELARAGNPASLPPARKRAEAAEKAALAGWESRETARQAYWAAERDAMRQHALATMLQLVADLDELARRAGGLASPGHHVQSLLAVLAASTRPPHGVDAEDVPSDPTESAVLERADDEL